MYLRYKYIHTYRSSTCKVVPQLANEMCLHTMATVEKEG